MTTEKRFYVYGYVRSKDSEHGPVGSYYYIGKGKDDRAYSRCRSISVPKEKSNILMIAGGMGELDALQAEMFLIHLHGRLDNGTGILHNLTDGGEGMSGHIPSAETREKIAESKREFHTTHPEAAAQLSLRNSREYSRETRLRMSESRKALLADPEQRNRLSITARANAKRGQDHPSWTTDPKPRTVYHREWVERKRRQQVQP